MIGDKIEEINKIIEPFSCEYKYLKDKSTSICDKVFCEKILFDLEQIRINFIDYLTKLIN